MAGIEELARKLACGENWQDALYYVNKLPSGELVKMSADYKKKLQLEVILLAYKYEKENKATQKELISKYATTIYISDMTPTDNYDKTVKITKKLFRVTDRLEENNNTKRKNKLKNKYEELTSQIKPAKETNNNI
jgi:hypothetical protein